MQFNVPSSPEISFYLTLLTCVDHDQAIQLDLKDDIIFLNPDYIMSSFHIMQAVNKACYNFLIHKTKSKSLKKEIIHAMTNHGKLEESLNMHSISSNKDNNHYIIFVNYTNCSEQIIQLLRDLKGNEISSENYVKFINFEALPKAFGINQCELEDDNENGLFSSIYNRIAIKDLK